MNANELERFLRQENIYCDCYEENGAFTIELEGDWKHDHWRMRHILEEEGYNVIRTYCADNGEDFYFAKYFVRKMSY